MSVDRCLTILVIVIPVLAGISELIAGTSLAERHHLHHDTYAVSMVVSRTLVLVMVFMGVLGSLTGWLCRLGVYNYKTDTTVPLAFFVSFQMTLFLMVIAVMRYRVMAYEDYMIVRPAFGRERSIAYKDIVSMEWVSSFLGPHLRDLKVYAVHDKPVRLWCLLDLEQLLLRIDRIEVLEG